jgi:Family of unknown function (DUF5681)
MGAGNAGDFEVGYKRPPKEHRFQKGKSGNPSGSRKGTRSKTPARPGLGFGEQPANAMLLEEAYRTVSVREGDKVVELPVIKAVFRALGVSAMKGNRLAQSAMAELIRSVEEEDRKLRVEHFSTACDYKVGWELEIEKARRLGLPEPTPLPHPDDVIIDVRRAEVRYAGPMTPEEKERWDRLLEFRDEQQEFVSMLARLWRKTAVTDLEKRGQHLTSWMSAQACYDRINDGLPDRYKMRLADRHYGRAATLGLEDKNSVEGASINEGEAR